MFSIFRCHAITDGDLYTYELTMEIRRNLCVLFGGKCPAAVCNNLSRAKFDANRNISDATYNVPEVVCAFLKYKSDIDDAKSVITSNQSNQAGLFIDIHGHGHRFDLLLAITIHSSPVAIYKFSVVMVRLIKFLFDLINRN